jgi:hypothetical protein
MRASLPQDDANELAAPPLPLAVSLPASDHKQVVSQFMV